jgi:hypothetical protein
VRAEGREERGSEQVRGKERGGQGGWRRLGEEAGGGGWEFRWAASGPRVRVRLVFFFFSFFIPFSNFEIQI